MVIPGQGGRGAGLGTSAEVNPTFCTCPKPSKMPDVIGPCFSSESKNPSVCDLVVTGSLEGAKPHLLDARVV